MAAAKKAASAPSASEEKGAERVTMRIVELRIPREDGTVVPRTKSGDAVEIIIRGLGTEVGPKTKAAEFVAMASKRFAFVDANGEPMKALPPRIVAAAMSILGLPEKPPSKPTEE